MFFIIVILYKNELLFRDRMNEAHKIEKNNEFERYQDTTNEIMKFLEEQYRKLFL